MRSSKASLIIILCMTVTIVTVVFIGFAFSLGTALLAQTITPEPEEPQFITSPTPLTEIIDTVTPDLDTTIPTPLQSLSPEPTTVLSPSVVPTAQPSITSIPNAPSSIGPETDTNSQNSPLEDLLAKAWEVGDQFGPIVTWFVVAVVVFASILWYIAKLIGQFESTAQGIERFRRWYRRRQGQSTVQNQPVNQNRDEQTSTAASTTEAAQLTVSPQLPKTPGKLRVSNLVDLPGAQYFEGQRSQIRQLKRFWKEDTGVAALVGIGGSGKTSIVRKYLEEQGWLEAGNADDQPDGLFIWSFYNPHADPPAFLNAAYRYFSPWAAEQDSNSSERHTNEIDLAEVLEQAGRRALLILDGLERVQSDGNDGLAKGALKYVALQNLLRRIAEGECGQTKAIVTSRFFLTDLEATRPSYKKVEVDQLDRPSAHRLLRRLGVSGADIVLDLYILHQYGSHALTLDLLGRLIKEQFNGNPSKVRNLPPLKLAKGSSEIDKQSRRFARVLSAYESILSIEERAIMNCLSVLRDAVEFEFLENTFLGTRGVAITGGLVNLSPEQFRATLEVLVARRLVIKDNVEGTELFTCHAAVRDHFYSSLTNSQELHAAVRSELATLVDRPGFVKPRDEKAIDLIIELIYHTIQTGYTNQAFEIYRNLLGYTHIGWSLGKHSKGAQIVRLFEEAASRGDIEVSQWDRIIIDGGLYYKNMGLLDDGIQSFTRAVSQVSSQSRDKLTLALAWQNLSAMQVLRGLLPDAQVSAQNALNAALETTDNRLIGDCQVRLAVATGLQGKTDEATNVFQTITFSLAKESSGPRPRDWPTIRWGWLLTRLGKYTEAYSMLENTRDLSDHLGHQIISARANVLLVEPAYQLGKREEALQALDRVDSWAKGGFDLEMVVAYDLVAAWLALQDKNQQRAKELVSHGIRIAEEYGYGIYWIDLKTIHGYIIPPGDQKSVERCADLALNGSGRKSGHPILYGAQSDRCNYRWGEANALQLRAEARLALNKTEEAVADLREVQRIRTALRDPQLAATETLLEKLNPKA